MPMFSVRCEDPAPMNPNWHEIKLRISARTKAHAMRRVSKEFIPLKPISAHIIKPDDERNHWRRIWVSALENMPVHVHVKRTEHWEKQPSGSVKIGKVIKGIANGTIKQDSKGRIAELMKRTYRFNRRREKALTVLLGYCQKTRYGPNTQVMRGLAFGTVPRDTGKRELLKALAKPDGQHLALKLLSEPYRKKGDNDDTSDL